MEARYVIAATDNQGLGTPGPHPYLVGDSEGMGALDSMRAARKGTRSNRLLLNDEHLVTNDVDSGGVVTGPTARRPDRRAPSSRQPARESRGRLGSRA